MSAEIQLRTRRCVGKLSKNLEKALILPGATKTAFPIPDDITFEEWEDIGFRIMSVTKSCMWWLGDWWAFGEHRYGERAAQALESDYSFQTFMDAGWVSNKIETSRRREALSWSHHREVAALKPNEKDALLDYAEANKDCTSRKLRQKELGRASCRERA